VVLVEFCAEAFEHGHERGLVCGAILGVHGGVRSFSAHCCCARNCGGGDVQFQDLVLAVTRGEERNFRFGTENVAGFFAFCVTRHRHSFSHRTTSNPVSLPSPIAGPICGKSPAHPIAVLAAVTDKVPCPWFATETDSKAPDAVLFYLVTATRQDIYRSTKPIPSSRCLTEEYVGLQLSQSTRNRRREAS
jgi:hypothetical protein